MFENLNSIERLDGDIVTDFIMPIKYIVEGDINNTESLLIYKALQIEVGSKNCIEVCGKSFIVLDFGQEIQGGIRILTNTIGDSFCKIRIRFGESLSETYSELKANNNNFTATNDHSLRDFETNLVSYSDMQFGQTGFRFVRIDFISGFKLTIRNIVGAYTHRNLERIGSFECDDEKINKIFNVSARTVELCMQNMLWDGIKRDRLVWVGDMHPEAMSIIALFGKDKCLEKSLDYIREATVLPNFMNGMPAYSLWWLCIISDYYMHNKDFDFLSRNKNYIIDLINLIDFCVKQDGKLEFDSYFLDWQSSDSEARIAGVYALCSYALSKTKILFNALNLDLTIINNILSRINKSLDGGNFKQVCALKILGGHASSKNPESFENLAKNLLDGGANGLSTFMSYYIFSAIAESQKTDGINQAFEIMREYYGAMLDRGATTFWEDFNMDWLENSNRIDELPKVGQKDIHGDFGAYCYKGFRHSLCHGWSSGPVPFIMHYILGVREIEAGCSTIQINPPPFLCGLKYARGSYPTPYGQIKIEHKFIDGQIKTNISAPKEIKIKSVE